MKTNKKMIKKDTPNRKDIPYYVEDFTQSFMENEEKLRDKSKSNKQCACGEKASFFHSKCCNAHFEGVIDDTGTYKIVCENCGKYCADVDRGEWIDIDFQEIYDGKTLSVWKEGDLYHFSTANVTLNFLEDEWKEFRKDLNKFNDI